VKPIVEREQLGRLVHGRMRALAPSWSHGWDGLDEEMREACRDIGEAVAAAVFEAAMGRRVGTGEEQKINVQSGFGVRTREPFVTITLPGSEPTVQLLAHEARDLAVNLLEAAEGALTDGLIVEFFTRQGGMKLEEVAPILTALRAYRTRKSKEGA
jgi:hypothetical protein